MEKQTAGRDNLGDFAPEFARLNDDILFGEVWAREDKLSLKLRSIVTISVFMGKGLINTSLEHHIILAKKNGVTKEEMAEIITHAAFYAGWPNAWGAFNIAKEVYSENELKENNEHGGMFGLGEPNVAFSKYFIGKSYLKPLTKQGEGSIAISNVTFEPRCRNNWHIHNATKDGGQILIGIDGEGWYQEEGKDVISIKQGDVIVIPANTKHWHGAKENTWFSHIAISVPGENTSTTWLEEISDIEYDKLI